MGNILNQSFLKMFAKKRKRRGTMWASILGIGISAAVFGLTRGKQRDVKQPIQKMIQSVSPKMNLNNLSTPALTEFSEELLASALKNDKYR